MKLCNGLIKIFDFDFDFNSVQGRSKSLTHIDTIGTEGGMMGEDASSSHQLSVPQERKRKLSLHAKVGEKKN